jgi:Arc/MetJ-type ribon-helix-helix transcriptional regulator
MAHQMNLVVTPEFERALQRLMKRRGFTTKSEAVRAVVEEAAGPEESWDETRERRRKALASLTGIIKEPFDWRQEKAWIYEGMDVSE